jgi:hypothetical protein
MTDNELNELVANLRAIGDEVIRCRPSEAEQLIADYMTRVDVLAKNAADAIESLRRERDALAAELLALREQEPVATVEWCVIETGENVVGISNAGWLALEDLNHGDKLYAAPVPSDALIAEALEIGRDYLQEAIARHDASYGRHHATEPARDQMLAFAAKVDAAILAAKGGAT